MSNVFGEPPACLECGRPVEQLDPIHGRYRTVHSWCVNRRRERLRREREAGAEPPAPQEARRGRNGRPAYSICRQCGRRIPPPAHGPMRKYCDRACENAWRRAQARAAEEAHQRGLRAARTAVDDLEERTRLLRDLQRDKVVIRDHAQEANAANDAFLARLDPTAAQEPPTQGS